MTPLLSNDYPDLPGWLFQAICQRAGISGPDPVPPEDDQHQHEFFCLATDGSPVYFQSFEAVDCIPGEAIAQFCSDARIDCVNFYLEACRLLMERREHRGQA